MAETTNVLGLSLGTRMLGMAVGNSKGLINWRMKAFLETFSKKKVRKIWRAIEKTIDHYGVTAIGIKITEEQFKFGGVNQCFLYITEKALEKGIPLHYYDLETIENMYIRSGKKNKTALAEKMAEKYPVLKNEYFRVTKSDYYLKLFEAVAVMDLAVIELL